MGTRTMGSHGAGGGNGGIQHPKSDGLSKQGALYNLTLDEVQHQLGDLGKPLSSMNLDELLKNVWTAEGESNQAPGPLDLHHHTQLAFTSSMARQSSLADLSKKTVDELWQDIQKKDTTTTHTSSGNDNNGGSGGGYNLERKSTQEKQQTLGEMTLEDFLAKAGIVAEEKKKKNSGSVIVPESIQNIVPQQAQWMQYQTPAIPQQQQQQHVFMPGHHQAQQSLPMEAAYPDTHMTVSPLMGTLSDTQTPGRKRVASGDVIEKTVERRQKRMIKNRESAARSRARKQAYTHELENKVSRLEEENERLKREQEAENVLACVPPPEPKYQLRRTSSASF